MWLVPGVSFFKANISKSGTLKNDMLKTIKTNVKQSISKNGSLKNDRGAGKWGGVGGLECSQATLPKRVPFLLPKFLGLSRSLFGFGKAI